MKPYRVSLLLLILAGALAPSIAAETAYDFTVCTHTRYTPLETDAEIVTFGVEIWGVVSSSTTKFWENASTHCVGYVRMMGGKVVGKGTCGWIAASGDTAVGEWEYPPVGEPAWTWLTGGGKLKGISGGGTFRELFSAKPSAPGTGQGCRRDWGKFNLP